MVIQIDYFSCAFALTATKKEIHAKRVILSSIRKLIPALVFCIILSPYVFSDANNSLAEIGVLYGAVKNKPALIVDIPICEQITSKLEHIIQQNVEDKELLKKIYPIIIDCYDRQARYSEEYKALEKYAEMISNGDREKAAEIMRINADKLREQGVIFEAIGLYGEIAKEYRETRAAPESLFQIARINEIEARQTKRLSQPVINEYHNLIDKYPQNEFAKKAYERIINLYEQSYNLNKAIEMVEEFFGRYPDDNRYAEEFLFKQFLLYQREGNWQGAEKIREIYLTKYGKKGNYTKIMQTF